MLQEVVKMFNKNLYSKAPYEKFIKAAKKDYREAACTLEYEMLLSNKINDTMIVRCLYCYNIIEDYDAIRNILYSVEDLSKNYYVYICKAIIMKLDGLNNNCIIQYIENCKKMLKFNIEDFYFQVVMFYNKYISNEYALKELNEILTKNILSKAFNAVYEIFSEDRESICKKLIKEDTIIRIRAMLEYARISVDNNNIKIAQDCLQYLKNTELYGTLLYNEIQIKIYDKLDNFIDIYRICKKKSLQDITGNVQIMNNYINSLYNLGLSDIIVDIYEFLKKDMQKFLNIFKKYYLFYETIYAFADNIKLLSNREFTNLSKIHYNLEIKKNSSDKKLYIFVSHNEKNIAYKNRLKGTSLFLSDNYYSWYNFYPEYIINYIYDNFSNYDLFHFIGASRGGYGSLLLGYLLSYVIDKKIYISAFSPQTKVYPYNDEVYNVSDVYKHYMLRCRYNFFNNFALAYGDLRNLYKNHRKNLHAYIFTGDKMQADYKEAMYIKDMINIINFNNCSSHYTLLLAYRDQEYFESKILNGANDYNYKDLYDYKKSMSYDFYDMIDAVENQEIYKFNICEQ